MEVLTRPKSPTRLEAIAKNYTNPPQYSNNVLIGEYIRIRFLFIWYEINVFV